MEIHQMRYLRTIVEQGSFSKAAEVLHMTQPALSKSIAKLEEEIGAPLLERGKGGIRLTSAGQVLLPYCGSVLNTVECGLNAVQESIGLEQGRLSIAVSTEVFIKHLILEFLTQYPQVSFTCHLMSLEEMSHALTEGQIDFALSEEPVYGENIEWYPIYHGHLTAVLHHEDPLLKKSSIRMEELRDHYFCIGHVRSNLHTSLVQLCNEAGFQPKIRYLGYDPDMAGMLLNIPGSVIVSSNMIDQSIQKTPLPDSGNFSVPIQGTEGKRTIGMAVYIGHYQSQAALRFYDMISDYFQGIR